MFEKLRDELTRYVSPPQLLSTGDDGRAHAVAVNVSWDGDQLLVSAGKRSLANVAARRLLSVLWAAPSADDYSLIVDGEGVINDSGSQLQVRVTITRAVLHRPGAAAQPSACGSDCRPLFG